MTRKKKCNEAFIHILPTIGIFAYRLPVLLDKERYPYEAAKAPQYSENR